jgi:hypothetical protein
MYLLPYTLRKRAKTVTFQNSFHRTSINLTPSRTGILSRTQIKRARTVLCERGCTCGEGKKGLLNELGDNPSYIVNKKFGTIQLIKQ